MNDPLILPASCRDLVPGIDLYDPRRDVHWPTLRDLGLRVCVAKTSEGLSTAGGKYAAEILEAACGAGFRLGGYHYCKPLHHSPTDEGRYARERAQDCGASRQWLDWEGDDLDAISDEQQGRWLLTALQTARAGVDAGIYTSLRWLRHLARSSVARTLAEYPLWVAWYPTARQCSKGATPKLPKPFAWKGWQFTSGKTKRDGVELPRRKWPILSRLAGAGGHRCDLSVWRGV